MSKLMVISVEGYDLVARSPRSEIELARVRVLDDSTAAHKHAACQLMRDAFESLNAEGFERAYSHLYALNISGKE